MPSGESDSGHLSHTPPSPGASLSENIPLIHLFKPALGKRVKKFVVLITLDIHIKGFFVITGHLPHRIPQFIDHPVLLGMGHTSSTLCMVRKKRGTVKLKEYVDILPEFRDITHQGKESL
jgi:hypothetical protein